MTEAKLDLTHGDLLTQRGIVGGLLSGAFLAAQFALASEPRTQQLWQANATHVVVMCSVLGIAANHIAFELFMPRSQRLLERFGVEEFRRILQAEESVSYEALRAFRERYFERTPSGDHHATRLAKHESLRRTSTYLTSAGVLGAVVSLSGYQTGAPLSLAAVALAFAAAGLWAQLERTRALGRALAYAFREVGGTSIAQLSVLPFSKPAAAAQPQLPIKAAPEGAAEQEHRISSNLQ
jgi:hypothetical protein